MAKVIMVATQKGGVGKTTITTELAANFKKLGKRVLIIDNDPQRDIEKVYADEKAYDYEHNLSSYILENDTAKHCVIKTTYFDLVGAGPKLITLRHNGEIEQLSILQDNLNILKDLKEIIVDEQALSIIDKGIGDNSKRMQEVHNIQQNIFRLKDLCEELDAEYDIILIDNNPQVGYLFNMSVIASDYIIIPSTSDHHAVREIELVDKLLGIINEQKIKNGENPVKTLAYVQSITENTGVCAYAKEELLKLSSNHTDKPIVFSIPKAKLVVEASWNGEPVTFTKSGSPLSRKYYELAQKILEKIEEE